MINKINSLVTKYFKLVAPATFMVALFQIPLLPANFNLSPILKGPAKEAVTKLNTASSGSLSDVFFGAKADAPETQAIVAKQVNLVSTRDAFPASLAVVEKHANTIERVAEEKGVPADVAIGVALLENGGSETAVSSAGALGVFQLMPGTARNLGLTVTKAVDDRKDPQQNITAGVSYLAANYERFGDWGLATWAYHAGEGNVAKALKIYAKTHDGIELKGVKDVGELRGYVEKNGITIHKLLSDPAVKRFTDKLHDDSSGYPYKVVATAKLFREADSRQALTSR